jgi:Domain of unknown function (DUF4177)
MRRWQYKVVQQRILVGAGGSEPEEDRVREALLDRYGREGWELVSVSLQSYRREYDPTSLQGYSFFSYFFKREEPVPGS